MWPEFDEIAGAEVLSWVGSIAMGHVAGILFVHVLLCW
jgi:hypothetical protein